MDIKSRFDTVEVCDLCGYNKPEFFLSTPDRNFQTGVFTYLKCPKCTLIWLCPRPNKKYINDYYPQEYGAYQTVTSPTPVQKIVRYLIKNNSIVAKLLIKDELFFWKNKGKILDVGTGNGSYLNVLSGWGWDAHGLEFNKEVVQRAKKAGVKNIHYGQLLDHSLPINHYDVVRYSHVMEHVPSARKEIQGSWRILKRGGTLLMLVPNIDSLMFKVFKDYWYLLDPPRHFYQFTPKTITRYLKEEGFQDIRITYYQSPYSLFRSFLFFLGVKKVNWRVGFLFYPLSLILRILNPIKASDDIQIYAVRK